MKNRIFAWINLAYRMAIHVGWRMPSRALGRRPDYKRFVATMNAEGYVPLAPAERAQFPAMMQCFHCGLCSLACNDLRASPRDGWYEPWTFVAGPSRSLDRAALVAHDLTQCVEQIDPGACPAGVPFAAMGAMYKRHEKPQEKRMSAPGSSS